MIALWDTFTGTLENAYTTTENYISNTYEILRGIFGNNIASDTRIVMPLICSGNGEVSYTNEYGYTQTVVGTYSFTTNLVPGHVLFDSQAMTAVVTGGTGAVQPTTLVYHSSGSTVYSISISPSLRTQLLIAGREDNPYNGTCPAYRTVLPHYIYAMQNSQVDYRGFRVVQPAISNLSNDTAATVLLENAGQGQTVTPQDIKNEIVYVINEKFNFELDPDEFPEIDEETTEPTEPTEPTTDVNGSIVINNYDNTVFNANMDVSGDASVSVSGSVDVNANAGAFGAGAFAAGAFGYADIDVNLDGEFNLNLDGTLDIHEINLNGDATTTNNLTNGDITYNNNINGGDITYNNTYNYNYTLESGAIIEMPTYPMPEIDYTIDYDEIISEGELESILSAETYSLETLDNSLLTMDNDVSLPPAKFDERAVSLAVDTVNAGTSLLQSWGMWGTLVACAVVTVLIAILK